MTTDVFTISKEEVDRRLRKLIPHAAIIEECWCPSESDNLMRLVRAEIRKRELREEFAKLVFLHQVCGGAESLIYGNTQEDAPWVRADLMDVFNLIDAPTELQSRCALAVMEEK